VKDDVKKERAANIYDPDAHKRWTSERLCRRIEELSEQKRKASMELREYLGLPKPPISFDSTLIRAPVDDERIRSETKAQLQSMRDKGLVD